MEHNDHVRLIRKGVTTPGGVWADLGSGWGAFTLALADLLGPGGRIYSVDKNQGSLREQEQAMRARFPQVNVQYINADFTRRLDLPPLDGIVMANSLHFIRKKDDVLQLAHSYLRPGGHFVLVEYNADSGNPWVPYPFTYGVWESMAQRNHFNNTTLLERYPSRFLNGMYSALSIR
jgi:ubiquinone/menaquinone biosynthesis C-methylase UbiE